MRKLSSIYSILLECVVIFTKSTICNEITYIRNAKKITQEEYVLLVKDFALFQPKDAKKGDHWFKDTAERIEFLKTRIENLKKDGL